MPTGGVGGPERRYAVGEPSVLRLTMPQLPADGATAGRALDGRAGAAVGARGAPVAPAAPVAPVAPVLPGVAARLIAFCAAGVSRLREIVPFLMSLFWIVPSLICDDVISEPATALPLIARTMAMTPENDAGCDVLAHDGAPPIFGTTRAP